MKQLITIFLASLIILINTKEAASQDNGAGNQCSVTSVVTNTVETSMCQIIESIPDNMLINYGINDRNELNNSIIGLPIEVYNIINGELIFTKSWRVPLIINNEYRALFTVVCDDTGSYKIVDFGATILAQEIFNESEANTIKGILRVYEIRKDFFINDNAKGEPEFHPVPNPGKEKYTTAEVLKMITP